MTNRTPEEIAASIQKVLAEADAAAADAEQSRAAAREHDANVSLTELNAEHLRHLIEQTRIEAEMANIALAQMAREERISRTNDLYYRSYTFDSAVSEKSVKQCIQTITAWSRDEPGCGITLYLNSPGGDIVEGFALIDFLVDLRRRGHHVRTIALGMAASMSAVILQAGDERIMGSNAILLIHEGSLGAVGSFGEVEDRVALMTKLHARIFQLFADRALPLNSKTTVAYLKKQAKRTDWWLDSSEALALGIVDSVL